MLNTTLVEQGIIKPQRLRLLCIPDYLFFRTHSQRLYREFSGIPRYSIISRKVTDQYDDFGGSEDNICSLETLYIVDGSTALLNAPFYFPLAEQLDMNVIGTKLDIAEIPKLRFTSIENKNFRKYVPTAIASDEVHYHAAVDGTAQDSKSISLPKSFKLFTQPIIPITKNTITVGSVRRIDEFTPTKFDLLRINIGDFVEYNQLFFSKIDKSSRINAILDQVNTIITCFDIKLVLISLYKIAKYFSIYPKGSNLKKSIEEMAHQWGFKEATLIMNEKRRKWKKVPLDIFKTLFDGNGYIAMFNHPSKAEKIKF
ncbi:MAG: hypothetical protein ACW97X_09715 [Candidatus Hodarchaeales archaeon]|jgi:hypothetical protein